MARRTTRRTKAQRRQRIRRTAGLVAVGLAGLLFLLMWHPWLLVGVLFAIAAFTAGWNLWRADRRERDGDRAWRERERRLELNRSMAAIDAMTWQDFEHYVAELCRRDGCADATVVGGSGDLAADIVGHMPDGRRLVVQVKHYRKPQTSCGRR